MSIKYTFYTLTFESNRDKLFNTYTYCVDCCLNDPVSGKLVNERKSSFVSEGEVTKLLHDLLDGFHSGVGVINQNDDSTFAMSFADSDTDFIMRKDMSASHRVNDYLLIIHSSKMATVSVNIVRSSTVRRSLFNLIKSGFMKKNSIQDFDSFSVQDKSQLAMFGITSN